MMIAQDWQTRNRRACELFVRAVEHGDWPGYRDPGMTRDRAFRVGLPPWATCQLQDRSEDGEFAVTTSAR